MKLLSIMIIVALGSLYGSLSAGLEIKVSDLRCEYLINPMGIDIDLPRLSWQLESKQRGQIQSAYRVLVASSRENLAKDIGDLWDTDKIESDQSIHVVYQGKTLQSRSRCYWKVMVWDKDGVASAWSATALWTMGLLDVSDWQAKWISTEVVQLPGSNVPIPDSTDAVYIRRTFTLKASPESAVAYVNVRGYYELYVNGQKVGDDVLTPAVTGIDKHLLYRTYDISSFIESGNNCVGIWLGQGWTRSQSWENTIPLVRAQFEVSAGGQNLLIGTDSNWTCAPSSHSRLGTWSWNNMGGECIDARRAIDKWSEADGPEELFLPVVEVPTPSGKVVAQSCPANRIGEVIPLKAVTDLGSDTWELDFGMNLTGWVRLNLAALVSGQKVTLRYSDRRFDDPNGENTPAGFIKPNSQWTVDTPNGQVTYQTYKQIDEFISAGKTNEQFCSKFNYHGFRYVIVQGLASAPGTNDAEALLIETDLEPAGSFACSKELFNRIHEVNTWTIRCLNLGGQMADCPHRERMGYGDGQTSIETQIMNRNAASFYTKWANDWMVDQDSKTGQFPHTSPHFVESWGGPGWGGLGSVLPWKMYLYYGDTRLLEQAYDFMLKYAQFLESKSTDNILRQETLGREQFLGDWVPPRRGMDSGNWPETLACEIFNNGYRLYLWQIMEGAARALGKISDADQYAALLDSIRPAIHETFYNVKNNQYGLDEQVYQVMPLMTGIVPESLRETVQTKLENLILVKNSGHLDTGMLGTYFLIQYLHEAGRSDLLYGIYNQKTYPGWGYMISRGATTFWEQWNGYWSQIHSCFASPGSWFYQGLGGIRLDPAVPAFKKIIIKPEIVGDLTWVNCYHNSMYGRVVCNWEMEESVFSMDIEVPTNTTATVYVPAKKLTDVLEGGHPAIEVVGVKYIRMDKGCAVFEIESGSYTFASKI